MVSATDSSHFRRPPRADQTPYDPVHPLGHGVGATRPHQRRWVFDSSEHWKPTSSRYLFPAVKPFEQCSPELAGIRHGPFRADEAVQLA